MTDTADLEVVEVAAPTVDLYKTVVRLIAGGVGEGVDRLVQLAEQLDTAEVAPEGELVGPIAADPRLMLAVGWASELPGLVKAAGESAYRMGYPFMRASGVIIDTAAFAARLTGVADVVNGLTEPLRTAIADEMERLTAVGTGEYARGRVLAVHAFEESVEGIVGLLSESEELGELVREQTIGVGGAAVQEIRETGAAADSLTEGVFRRLLRRGDRPLPPKAVDEP